MPAVCCCHHTFIPNSTITPHTVTGFKVDSAVWQNFNLTYFDESVSSIGYPLCLTLLGYYQSYKVTVTMKWRNENALKNPSGDSGCLSLNYTSQ